MVFITFEGIEGCGKSTQSEKLKAYLESKGFDCLLTFEPGDCELGRVIRRELLQVGKNPAPLAELFLFLADRAQHVGESLRPALEKGRVVICDRFIDSTLAYQGYGRGMDVGRLIELNDIATGGLRPDLTFLLDLPVETGLKRAGRRNVSKGVESEEGRFEAEAVEFHQRVRSGFLKIAEENPERFVIADSTRSLTEVYELILETVTRKLSA